jgi:hypothetical protein
MEILLITKILVKSIEVKTSQSKQLEMITGILRYIINFVLTITTYLLEQNCHICLRKRN